MTFLSLSHLTAISLPPPELIRVAHRTGYQSVGLRLIQVTPESPGYPLMDNPQMLHDTRVAMDETGVRVWDIEFVKLTRELKIPSLEPFIAVGAALGAKYAIAAPYDPELPRLVDRFGAFCDLAQSYGMGVVLEFFPWTQVPGLSNAAAIVETARRVNGGILIDMLHYDRSNSTVTDIKTVAPTRFPYVQLCDSEAVRPTDLNILLHHARAERLPPGEGGLDILGLLQHLPKDIPIALEVPMTALTAEIGAEAVALRVRQAATKLLGWPEPELPSDAVEEIPDVIEGAEAVEEARVEPTNPLP